MNTPKKRYRIIEYDVETGKTITQFDDLDLDTAYASAHSYFRNQQKL